MTCSLRVRALFLFVLSFVLLAGGVARAAGPDDAKLHRKLANYGIGTKVKLKLADHSRVKGTIYDIGESSVDVLPKGEKTAVTLAFADVASVRATPDLHGRFKTGPCVGPISLAIASPVILIAALLGH